MEANITTEKTIQIHYLSNNFFKINVKSNRKSNLKL